MNEAEPYDSKPILDMTMREVPEMEARAQRVLGLPSTYVERFKVSGDIAYLKDAVKFANSGGKPYTTLEVLEMLDKRVNEADGVNGVDLWQKSDSVAISVNDNLGHARLPPKPHQQHPTQGPQTAALPV